MPAVTEVRHLGVGVDRPAAEVYAVVTDPVMLPRWAAGLAAGEVSVTADGLLVDSPMGQVRVRFVPANDLGVADHAVTLPDGSVTVNPLRVLDDGERCDVVFTLRRRPGTGEEEFEADATVVAADLERLRRLVESGPP